MIYEEALYQVYVPLPIDWWVFPGVMFRGFMSLSSWVRTLRVSPRERWRQRR